MSNIVDALKDYTEMTITQLVDFKEDVNVNVSISTKAVIVQIKVEKSDCGKVIGRKGRTVDALKVLCLAIKNTKFPSDSRKVILEVLEDENSDFKYTKEVN